MFIKLIQRSKNAFSTDSILNDIKKTENTKIAPSKCPAIHNAYTRGTFISSPRDYTFEGNSFLIHKYKTLQNEIIIDPGIIGVKESNHIYARIDVGFSFLNLPCDILATPILATYFNQNLQIPSVIYNKGYNGPILAPISSLKSCHIKKGHPILQLIPLTENYTFDVEIQNIKHENFEGLFYFSNEDKLDLIDSYYSSQFEKAFN